MIWLLLTLIVFARPAFAADITVTCPNDSSTTPTSLTCTKSANVPLFSYQNIAPGFLTNPPHVITVENLDDNNPCFLKAEIIKNLGDSLLLEGTDRLNLSITSSTSLLYSGPLIFANLNLGQVDIGSTKNYYWTVSFPVSAGNSYQNLSANFDINLNFTCADNPFWKPSVANPTTGVYLSEYLPKGNEWVEIFNNNDFPVILNGWKIDNNPTGGMAPKNIPTNTTIPAKSYYVFNITGNFFNNDHDYVVLINNLGQIEESTEYFTDSATLSWTKQTNGLWCLTTPSIGTVNNPCPGVAGVSSSISVSSPSSSPPTCTDPKPATPIGLSVTSALGSANLSWTPISPPLTSYLIAYGPTSDNILYGNPNIGLSTNYTVAGLTPGAAYCFYVRSQNGCMPGDASEIVCINTGSNIPIVETEPPAGFQPEILGENTDASQINQTTLEEDLNLGGVLGDSDSSCPTIYIPLLFVIAFLLNSLIFLKNPHTNLFLPFLLSLTAFIIDYFLLKKYCCRISFLCRFFYLGNILSLILPKLIFKFKNA